jgi:hypothetical protein
VTGIARCILYSVWREFVGSAPQLNEGGVSRGQLQLKSVSARATACETRSYFAAEEATNF